MIFQMKKVDDNTWHTFMGKIKHSKIMEEIEKKVEYKNQLIEKTSKRLIICKLYQISSDITKINSIKMKKSKLKLNQNIFSESLEQKEYCV